MKGTFLFSGCYDNQPNNENLNGSVSIRGEFNWLLCSLFSNFPFILSVCTCTVIITC